MKQDSETTTKKNNDIREKLKLYSLQLSQETDRVSEMRAEISELEAQLSCHTQVIEELRVQVSDVPIDHLPTDASGSTPATGGTSVDLSGRASLTALPEQVPVITTFKPIQELTKMHEDMKQTPWKRKQRPTYLLLVASVLSVVFTLSVSGSVSGGEKKDLVGQQPNTSRSNSGSAKPSVSGTRVIPQAVTASNRNTGYEPELATDGDLSTFWNSGHFAPQWIQFDLGENTAVSEVLLNVAQLPEGPTIHKIYGGPAPDKLRLLGTLNGNTQSGQWLDLKIKATDVRYLKVLTSESPSWIAWCEIEVYK